MNDETHLNFEIIRLPEGVKGFTCPNCEVWVDGESYEEALESTEFQCGITHYRVISPYVINEVGLG